jgi:arginyl-tRNA synthetase
MGVWGVMQKENEKPEATAPLKEKISFLGMCYAYANGEFETNEQSKKEIVEVNKAIYSGSDTRVMEVYAEGRALSLAYFDSLYAKLGTTFDAFIYESEVSDPGLALVKEYLGKGVFEESEGAIVYKGEQDGLHTRVFINKEGLPTYEAKDLGNYEKKLELVPNASHYVVVTASEQNEYFKVINTVAQKIHPDLVGKLTHISHGMMRLPTGKMSSRTGNVIGGEDMLEMIAEKIREKVKEMRVSDDVKEELVNDIAVGAIKFSILKIAPGKDIAFDFEKSISFEGDSGPYLQYTHARLSALLDKAQEQGVSFEYGYVVDAPERELEKIIIGYQEVLEKTYRDLGPQHIIQHLLLLTRVFNNLYARVQIVNVGDKDTSAYYVMLTTATKTILAHGLHTLGIKAPERM